MGINKKSIWKDIGCENVWGRRGLVKANSFWICLALLLLTGNPEQAGWPVVTLAQIYLAVYFWVLVSILANDLSDFSRDAFAGKRRWIVSVSYPGNWAIVIALSLAGLGLCILGRSPAGTRWVYLGATVIGLSYSLRPFRAKERGAWGLFVYSLSCTLGYVLLAWSWLGGPWSVLLVLCPAVFLDKWVNLHFHEILDHETDAERGVGTYAVRVGIQQAKLGLIRVAALAAVSAAALLIFTLSRLPEGRIPMILGTGGVLALGSGYVLWARRRSKRSSALIQQLPWPYLTLTLTVFRALPLVLFFGLALKKAPFWTIAAPAAVTLLGESWYSFRYRIF
jgi:4-hydroxybenzoate polyprenyltransferase